MKKMLIINLVLIIIYFVIPNVSIEKVEKIICLNAGALTQTLTISSRSGEIRQENKKIEHTSEKGIEILKLMEDCNETAVRLKGEKYLTIGYGHYGQDVQRGQTITKEQANELLRNDLKNYESYVLKYCDYLELNQNEFDALVMFVYNLGEGNLKMLTQNKTRTKEEIVNHWGAYVESQSESNKKGLTNRRNLEKQIFTTGDYTKKY